MLWLKISFPKQGLVSLPITKRIANPVIPELALAQVALLTIPTRVGTLQDTEEKMVTKTSKPWATSWFSDKIIDIIARKWTKS